MNKKQLVRLIQEQRPEPPHGFEARMEYQLARLTKEEQPMKKRYKFSTVLVAAALLVVVLAGTALAAGVLGIFDIFNTANPIKPLEGAEGIVATGLGSSENDLAVLTVEEAVFDGQGMLVKCRLSPKNPEKHAMLNLFYQDTPEALYNGEIVPVEVGEGSFENRSEDGKVVCVVSYPDRQELLINGESVEIPTDRNEALEKGLVVYMNNGVLCYSEIDEYRILDRKDGKETIGYWIDVNVGDDLIYSSWSDVETQEDGSVIFWASGFANKVLDVDSIDVTVGARLFEGTESGKEAGTLDAITFALPKSEPERLYNLVPVGDGKGERFEILSGSIAFTKVRGYFNVNYLYEQAETGEEMGITFHVYDAEGKEINMGGGNASVEPDENGVHWWSIEMQSFDEVPDTVCLEAKVVGWDKMLGRVECKLVEATGADVNAAESVR